MSSSSTGQQLLINVFQCMMNNFPPSPRYYRVGWISAVQTEYVIACELLDEEFEERQLDLRHDNNLYTFGRIGQHNVVLACLPKGKYGISSATMVARDMCRSFSLCFLLMVGIGGGAPTKHNDVRLGDIVVSCPVAQSSGVIHYDSGAAIQDKEFKRTGTLNAPPTSLLNAVQYLCSVHERRGHKITECITKAITKNPRLKQKYERPLSGTDILYSSTFLHPDGDQPCAGLCDSVAANQVLRTQRDSPESEPVVHYGLIASADKLMKDAPLRDKLAKTERVLCFEMEGAGLMDAFPCLVIRGICDYSDTHKNDIWQGYAAAAAAAYARELLNVIPSSQVQPTPQTADNDTILGIHNVLKPLISEMTM
ncbi:uncharacterized protein A1O9_00687 [Exophiala aquamarina CBS 119918]|uniref:Nucleoside phosphorylase domain-containing protein n=1 Tax=Exophiala aquamarina CBS 119918 TaxID=1182545 RepID=A0A072PRJ6_9EURO|nr:uncharacterized protein A1O9_00687 [Exophiala aquamarina CBS 119918]KEF62714.1 hypothetical protein A1O9_00687 [Exophiala aquamarina CBS 119918]